MRRHWRVLLGGGLVLALLLGVANRETPGNNLSRPSEPSPVLVGRVTRIIDGDGIWVSLDSGPIEVRLGYIDAPEANQLWGPDSAAALAYRVDGRDVALEVVTQDRYERLIAVVYAGDENINAWMVKQGHAWAYRQYAQDPSYCVWEGEARSLGSGLWAPSRVPRVAPWERRASDRSQLSRYTDYSGETVENCTAALGQLPGTLRTSGPPHQPRSEPPSGACLIKGNVSKNGRIYHTPGSRWYDETVIDTSKGERWFCSEREAIDAGWRVPR